MNFPVFSQLAGIFGLSETSSLLTASSSGESANHLFLSDGAKSAEAPYSPHRDDRRWLLSDSACGPALAPSRRGAAAARRAGEHRGWHRPLHHPTLVRPLGARHADRHRADHPRGRVAGVRTRAAPVQIIEAVRCARSSSTWMI